MKYNVVACGGTFDHFHKGHREFLRLAVSSSNKILLGITSDFYIKNSIKNGIEPFVFRRKCVSDFLKSENAKEKAEFFPLDDLYGSTLDKNCKIEALVVSENTLEGGKLINIARRKIKLPALPIIIKKMVKADDGRAISSNRIRNGEINREGKMYCKQIWLKSQITLPKDIRIELKKPMGKLLKNEKSVKKADFSRVLTVGDVVTKSFNNLNYGQKISAVDFYIKRRKVFSNLTELGFSGKEKIIKVENPAGCLTPSLFKAVKDIFKSKNTHRIIFKIEGEEDLCVLPFLIAAPLGFTIFYGQPDRGVVKVDVTEENKEKAYNLLNRFEY